MSDLFITLWLQSNLSHYFTKEICLPFTYKNWNEMRSNENETWVLYFLSLHGTLGEANKLSNSLCKP